MKAILYDSSGDKKGNIDLPHVFNSEIRQDLSQKYFEVFRMSGKQPFSLYVEAGKRHSASGTISHQRHRWKGHYGKGISRIPRKAMWRRGTQFFWIGAEVSGTRGGRVSHPPKLNRHERKINKKEVVSAMNSALASTAHKDYILKRYSSLSSMPHEKIEDFPKVIESLPKTSKEIKVVLEKLYPSISDLVYKNKSVRTGKGKRRGRKYKSNAGLLIIVSNHESHKYSSLDVKKVSDIKITDIFPLGRLVLFTEKSLHDLSKFLEVSNK